MIMNLNLLFKEIQRNALSFFLWTLVISVLVSVTMSVFPTFLQNQSKVLGMMTLVPKEALQFKGISNFTDMLSPLGFYSVNNIIYMMVLGSIFAMVLSSNILLKEEYNKTAEYLMVRPITRSEIFISKLSVVIFYIFLLNLVTALIGYTTIKLVHSGPFNGQSFLVLSVYTFLLNTLFGAIGLFMSTLVKRPKPITTLGIGMVLFFYFIYTLSKITESVGQIGYLSPFKYVRLDAGNPEYKLETGHLLYFMGISLLLLIISYRIYRRKDIYT
jgi:ABC-2 type transport system permease protein